MQFQIATDYAIRILLYLKMHKNELPTAMVIAQEMGITYPFFIKVANRLKNEGLISAVQGRNGGYYLGRPADEISLYDIIRAIEGDVILNRCLREDGFCSRNATEWCPVHKIFEGLQGEFVAKLDAIKIEGI